LIYFGSKSYLKVMTELASHYLSGLAY